MVRIWDTTLNAWRDAKAIRRYDQERQAFVDVEAVYATVDGVKRQVWPERLYLYKAGDECNDVTGGWVGGSGTLGRTHPSGVLTNAATKLTESNRIGFANYNDTSKYFSIKFIRTSRKIDITRYNKAVVKILYWPPDDTTIDSGTASGFGFSTGDFNVQLNPCYNKGNFRFPNSVQEYKLNLSAKSGEYYLVVYSEHVRNNTIINYMYLYEAYLTV